MEIALGIIATAFFALVGVIYHQLRERQKEHKEHCDAEIAALTIEVQRLRDWRHDEIAQVLSHHALAIALLKAKAGLE